MAAIDPTDTTPAEAAEPAEQTDVPVYMPGTPTLSFTTALERLYTRLFR